MGLTHAASGRTRARGGSAPRAGGRPMLSILFYALSWAVWWGGIVAIIKIDQKRRDAAMRAAGDVNFEDKSVLPYLVLGVICGGLVLPVYFWTTRKTGVGVLIGIGLAFVVAIVSGVFQAIGGVLGAPR